MTTTIQLALEQLVTGQDLDTALAYARFAPMEPARYRDGLLPND